MVRVVLAAMQWRWVSRGIDLNFRFSISISITSFGRFWWQVSMRLTISLLPDIPHGGKHGSSSDIA